MELTIGWIDIAFRLLLTVIAGSILGLNRSERGMTAGLRTTLLVCLAASISMIQVNLLLATDGKTPASFSVLDMMRLPLGILTGMGFIGAGAIVRRGDRVSGLTTAATLWLATTLGLCFGGGQHGLGLAALGLGIAILWLLKHVEAGLTQERRATFSLNVAEAGPSDDELRTIVEHSGGRIWGWDAQYARLGVRRKIRCEISWPDHGTKPRVPEFVRQLVKRDGVQGVRWKV
jgi:putative Mg2+ transporter-C (MgtC) family protein